MAKSLEGTYRGERWGFNNITSSNYYDSLTIEVSQVFVNNNNFDDSTSIYLSTITEYDDMPGTFFYDTVTIKDATGNVRYENENEYWMRNDSIYYVKYYQSWGGSNIFYEGLFLKE